jgi:hypothetical protein
VKAHQAWAKSREAKVCAIMETVSTIVLTVLGTLIVQQVPVVRSWFSSKKRVKASLRTMAMVVTTMRALDENVVSSDMLSPFRRFVLLSEDATVMADIPDSLMYGLLSLQFTVESYLEVVEKKDDYLEGRVRTMESLINRTLREMGDQTFLDRVKDEANKLAVLINNQPQKPTR